MSKYKNLTESHIVGFHRDPHGRPCDHCGTFIKNCVHIKGPQGEQIIGTSCAEWLGFHKYQLRHKLTDAELIEKKARELKKDLQRELEEAEVKKTLKKRMKTRVGKVVRDLEAIVKNSDVYLCKTDEGRECYLENDFIWSLARQLRIRNLSPRQAHFVCVNTVGHSGRRNKANAKDWDRVWSICTGFKPNEYY